MLNYARDGDTVVVAAIDRLGRSVADPRRITCSGRAHHRRGFVGGAAADSARPTAYRYLSPKA